MGSRGVGDWTREWFPLLKCSTVSGNAWTLACLDNRIFAVDNSLTETGIELNRCEQLTTRNTQAVNIMRYV